MDETIWLLLMINIGPAPAGEPGNADLSPAYCQIGVTLIYSHYFLRSAGYGRGIPNGRVPQPVRSRTIFGPVMPCGG